LYAALPPAGVEIMRHLSPLARELHLPLYLVGGPVRDLLLDRPCLDLDIAVEGDAISLARRLAEVTGARLRTHPAFLTASLRVDGFVLDIATARTETYAHPGALPKVRPASIHEDLLRRDFAINAMAIPLNDAAHQEVLDPSAGQADLKHRLIRALHPQSFENDATRILRAVRYEARFGFRVEEATLEWLRKDVGCLQTVSGARLRQELSCIFTEAEPERALRRLDALSALRAIQPNLTFDRHQVRAAAALRDLPGRPLSAALWPLLFWGVAEAHIPDLCQRLALTKPQRTAIQAAPALRELVDQRLQVRRLNRSTLVQALSPYPLPALWALAAATDPDGVREQCLDYLTKARHIRPLLGGNDIIALGVPEGPRVGEMLRRLRAAKLDGEVKSRTDEEHFVRVETGR
jgi:tRNA nucleotidyltransferase (CCA-adding enzyme)